MISIGASQLAASSASVFWAFVPLYVQASPLDAEASRALRASASCVTARVTLSVPAAVPIWACSAGPTHSPLTTGPTLLRTAVPLKSPLNCGVNNDCPEGEVVTGSPAHD